MSQRVAVCHRPARFSSARSQPLSHAGIASVPAERRITASRLAHLDWRPDTIEVRSWDESCHGRAKTTLEELSRTGGRERSSSLWLRLHHSFGSPQYAIAAHCFCKSIGARRPCTRHQSTVNAEPPRSTSTVQKPSSSPAANYNRTHKQDAQVRVT